MAHGIQLNTTAAHEHEPEIERAIGTIKERARCMSFPNVIKTALVKRAVTCLNMFPHADGVSDTISPRGREPPVQSPLTPPEINKALINVCP